MANATKEVKEVLKNGKDHVHIFNENLVQELKDSVEDISGKITQVTSEIASDSVSVMKKYPVHTALGACAIGFIAGALSFRK